MKVLPKRPARPAICLTSGGVRGLRLSPSNLERLVKMMRLHTDSPEVEHMSTGCHRDFACTAPVARSVDSQDFLELPESEGVALAELHLTPCKAAVTDRQHACTSLTIETALVAEVCTGIWVCTDRDTGRHCAAYLMFRLRPMPTALLADSTL